MLTFVVVVGLIAFIIGMWKCIKILREMRDEEIQRRKEMLKAKNGTTKTTYRSIRSEDHMYIVRKEEDPHEDMYNYNSPIFPSEETRDCTNAEPDVYISPVNEEKKD